MFGTGVKLSTEEVTKRETRVIRKRLMVIVGI
jgi:hypothetical protein